MASYKALKEIGEYNDTREFIDRDDITYRVVVLYGPFRTNHGSFCKTEAAAQAFVIREPPEPLGISVLDGIGMAFIGPGYESNPGAALEKALHLAMDEASFPTQMRNYVSHWMLGESVTLKKPEEYYVSKRTAEYGTFIEAKAFAEGVEFANDSALTVVKIESNGKNWVVHMEDEDYHEDEFEVQTNFPIELGINYDEELTNKEE